MKRLWICPKNDLESVTIIDLLERHGERLLVTGQRWGATWKGLEESIRQEVQNALTAGIEVRGIELAGPPPAGAHNIDHHRYAGDDRSHPLTSLEQTADVLGCDLSRHERLVAANDRGYIPGLIAAGASESEVAAIRAGDREAQGLTAEDEAQARRDVARAEWRGRAAVLHCEDRSTAWHTDLLYGSYDELLLASPANWVYFGLRFREGFDLRLQETCWSGGAPPNGFFGVAAPGPASQASLLSWFWTGRDAAD